MNLCIRTVPSGIVRDAVVRAYMHLFRSLQVSTCHYCVPETPPEHRAIREHVHGVPVRKVSMLVLLPHFSITLLYFPILPIILYN